MNILIAESTIMFSFLAFELENPQVKFTRVSTEEECWVKIQELEPKLVILSENLNCSIWLRNLRARGCETRVVLMVAEEEYKAFAEALINDRVTQLIIYPTYGQLAGMLKLNHVTT